MEMMEFDVKLNIRETGSGIASETIIHVTVYQAPSGFYIASSPALPKVAIGTSGSPRLAIIEYLGNLLYSQTVEAEMAREAS